MGRAIEMENQIDAMGVRLKKVEDALARVIETIDSMQSKSSKVKHVEKEKNSESKKQKADNEGNAKSSE
jgi:uncharacterized spore protein YtfJ